MCLPDTMSIYVKTGWNWIGFLPSFALPVEHALSKLKNEGKIKTGDLLKSRTTFAQYIEDPLYTGWIGNLKFMTPPNGYQLKLTTTNITNTTLVYPPQGLVGTDPQPVEDRDNPDISTYFQPNSSPYEKSATLIGMLAAQDINQTTAGMEIAAFSDENITGATSATYVPHLQSYLFFLTYAAKADAKNIHFKLYNPATEVTYLLNEVLPFESNNHTGSIHQPFPFTLPGTIHTHDLPVKTTLSAAPNPLSNFTNIYYNLPSAGKADISITTIAGKLLYHTTTTAARGLNTLPWDATDAQGAMLPSGVYLVRLKTTTESTICKVVIQR
jgi:hypothetical protein